MATPIKIAHAGRSQIFESSRLSENSNPNQEFPQIPSTPSKSFLKSPSIKQASIKKPAPKTPKPAVSPPPPPRDRKFVLAKKKSRKGAKDLDIEKRRQDAFEALRASQEGFFRRDPATETADPSPGEEKDPPVSPAAATINGLEAIEDVGDLKGSSKVRKMKSIVMENALSTIPEPGSGRVLHLVKAFENMLSITKEPETERKKKGLMNWALPGLQQPAKASETEISSFSGCSGDIGRDSRAYSSFDSNGDRLSWDSKTSSGGRRSRRNSTDSSGRSFTKMLKVTSQHPFKLRTEQRGRRKEEQFIRKVNEMLIEEEKKRIPIAQGLPWTTDEPEVLVKPPVKESTEPIDLVLHSDVRAVERAGFDHYVAERLSLAEQMKMERERQLMLEEEEEVRRLRRELVPRAQPMPYFDRPFVPKRSARPRTVPKEPRFHIRSKSSCISMLER